jgi:6-phosphogluconolactonase (cycloisomerase 2 family)
MTNETGRNRIIEYRRARNGELTRTGSIRTRGRGIGTDLDTQDALILSRDHRFLYAANAGSDNVSVFSVRGSELTFVQKVYAGDVPNSLTLHGDLLYVLEGSVAGNGIVAFRVADNGG